MSIQLEIIDVFCNECDKYIDATDLWQHCLDCGQWVGWCPHCEAILVHYKTKEEP